MTTKKAGVDVMITIFGEKLAFFSKTNVLMKFLDNLALFRVKNAIFFAEFFGKNIFKNRNNGPRSH
jgi:hypothetical protein